MPLIYFTSVIFASAPHVCNDHDNGNDDDDDFRARTTKCCACKLSSFTHNTHRIGCAIMSEAYPSAQRLSLSLNVIYNFERKVSRPANKYDDDVVCVCVSATGIKTLPIYICFVFRFTFFLQLPSLHNYTVIILNASRHGSCSALFSFYIFI